MIVRSLKLACALLSIVGASATLHAEPDCGRDACQIRVGFTGSMRPTLKGGEVLPLVPVSIWLLKARDCIVWRWEARGLNIIHRVKRVGIDAHGDPYVITQGDANHFPDPKIITAHELRGLVLLP